MTGQEGGRTAWSMFLVCTSHGMPYLSDVVQAVARVAGFVEGHKSLCGLRAQDMRLGKDTHTAVIVMRGAWRWQNLFTHDIYDTPAPGRKSAV
jgi:hypothetical protein